MPRFEDFPTKSVLGKASQKVNQYLSMRGQNSKISESYMSEILYNNYVMQKEADPLENVDVSRVISSSVEQTEGVLNGLILDFTRFARDINPSVGQVPSHLNVEPRPVYDVSRGSRLSAYRKPVNLN